MLFVIALSCLAGAFEGDAVEQKKEMPDYIEKYLVKEDIQRDMVREKLRAEFLKQIVETKPADRESVLEDFRHRAELEDLKVRVSLSYPLQVGDFGYCSLNSKVLQVLDEETYLISVIRETVYMVKGFDTTNLADDEFKPLRGLVRVTGTESYVTVAGAKKTVKVIEASSQEELDEWRQIRRNANPATLKSIEIPPDIDQLYMKSIRDKKAAAKKNRNK
ncbi:MAG: hypothetical protein U0872_14255 [Planctomycetaceae bacterium]